MSSNLTKKEIVATIHKATGFAQKEVQEAVQGTLDVITQALVDGRHVELRNFGVLEVQVRKERIGRNPNQPKKDVVIPERPVVKFKMGKNLRESLESQPVSIYKK